MKHLPLVLLAVLAALPPSAAPAAETAWTEVMPGARIRALSAGVEREGRALIGLEIQLADGIRTYWRLPGETGLPTELAIAAKDGVKTADIRWPLPEWDLASGYVDMVYHGEIVLPVFVEAPKEASLTLDVRMGLCSDICVPVQTRFELPGDTKSDPAQSLRLKQALNDTPILFEAADPPLTAIARDDETGALTLTYDPNRIDPERVFPSLDGRTDVFSAPEIDRDAHTLAFTLLTAGKDTSWRAAALRLTFATEEGPYEIVRNPETR